MSGMSQSESGNDDDNFFCQDRPFAIVGEASEWRQVTSEPAQWR